MNFKGNCKVCGIPIEIDFDRDVDKHFEICKEVCCYCCNQKNCVDDNENIDEKEKLDQAEDVYQGEIVEPKKAKSRRKRKE